MLIGIIKHILQNKIFWFLGSRYFILFIQFLGSVYVATKLGAYYFGIWSFIVLAVNVGCNSNLGVGNALMILLVQNKENKKLSDTYTVNSFLLTLIIGGVCFLAAAYHLLFPLAIFEKYHIHYLILVIGLLVLLQNLNNLLISVLRVKNKISWIIVQQTLWPAVMLGLVFCSKGESLLRLLITGYVAVFLLTLLLLLKASNVSWIQPVEKKYIAEMLKKGFFLFLYSAGFVFIMISTKSLLSYYYTVEEFGFFALAFILAQGGMMMIDSVLFLLFPKMIDMLKKSDHEKNYVTIQMFRKNYLLLLHIFLYIVLFGIDLFFMVVPQYKNSYLSFVFILFTLAMYSGCFGYNTFLLAQDKEKQFSFIVLFVFVLNVFVVWCLIKIFACSWEYVIFGTLFSYGIYCLLVISYALKVLSVKSLKERLRECFVCFIFPSYFLALLIVVLKVNKLFLFIPLAILLIQNRRDLRNVVKKVLGLIKNGKMLDV